MGRFRGSSVQALGAVRDALDAAVRRAVGAAVDGPARLDAVADHPAAAVGADRGERVDRALEAVEHVRLAAAPDLECPVVLVAADLAGGHASAVPAAAPV